MISHNDIFSSFQKIRRGRPAGSTRKAKFMAKQLSLFQDEKESLSGLAGQGVGSTKPVLLSDRGIFAKAGDLLTPRTPFLLTLCVFPADALGNRSFYRATTLPDAVGGVGGPKRLYVPVTRKVSLTDETKAGAA